MPRCVVCHRRLAPDVTCPADGARSADLHLEGYIGQEPPGYQDCSVLGIGGFATTWSVADSSGVVHALKWARRDNEASYQRFSHEADILKSLGGLGAPEMRGWGRLQDRAYLLMEQVEGPTLGAVLEGLDVPMTEEGVRALALSLVQAIDLVHRSGVVHRDLKPDNILLKQGDVTLIDFGLSMKVDTAEEVFAPAGTPEYAAPEQLRSGRISSAIDVYSLGVILYELICLRLPFLGDSMSLEYEHANLRPPPLRRFVSISKEFEQLVLDCLEKDPQRRPSLSELSMRLGDGERTVIGGVKTVVNSRGKQAFGAENNSSAIDSQRVVAYLLAASDVRLSVPELEILASSLGALVIEYRSGEVRLAWLGDNESSPLQQAKRCAATLESAGATRLCLHFDQVQLLRRRVGPPMLFGASLDLDASWRKSGNWGGLCLSTALQTLQTRPNLQASFAGREPELRHAMKVAEQCFETDRPSILSFVGTTGVGKTRILEELHKRLDSVYLDINFLWVNAESTNVEHGEAFVQEAENGPLCILVDDVLSLPNEVIDALEYASLAQELPLFLACSMSESEVSLRPNWGARAASHTRVPLPALPAASLQRVLTELLRPASYIPEAALESLVNACSGNIAACYELAATLHQEGYIQEQAPGRYGLDTSKLHSLPSQSVQEWMAAAQAAQEPPAMARLLCVCASVPDGFRSEMIREAVFALTELDGGHLDWPDSDVALAQWRHRGVLLGDGKGYRFPNSAVRDALARRTNKSHKSCLHETALRYWQQRQEPMALSRCAIHAQACGQEEVARDAWLAVGEEAARCHRPVEADRAFALAVADNEATDEQRLTAFLGMGRARYRMDRSVESVALLQRAAAIASELGEVERQIECLLECATALDWAQRFSESSDKVVEAAALAKATMVGIDHRLQLGRGRSAWRAGKVPQAIALLEDAAAASTALADFDSRVVSLMLLAPALVLQGQLEQAEARFAELLALCHGANDLLHLCSAYGNRMFLRSAKKDTEAARDDLQEAMRLARQIGHPIPERVATYNLAEDLYWSGEDDEQAHKLAQSAWRLAMEFVQVPVVEDALLVARTALALDNHEVASKALSWAKGTLKSSEWSEASRHFASMVDNVVDGGSIEDWNQLFARSAADMGEDDHLEIRYWFIRCAQSACMDELVTELIGSAKTAVANNPIWQARFQSLVL